MAEESVESMVRFLGPAAAVVAVSLALTLGCGETGAKNPASGSGGTAGAAGATAAGNGSGAANNTSGASSMGGSTSAAGTANGGSAGTSGNSLTEACIAYAVALCERRNECEGTTQNDASCLNTSYACPDVVTSSGSTRTVAVLQACALAYRTFACDDMLAGKLPDCVTPGTLPQDAPCKYASQCSTLDCKTGGMPCGVCAQMVGEGESCAAPNIDCLPEMTCDGGQCVKRPTQGPQALPGKPCVGYCVPDYYCEPTSKLCTAYPTAGMSCETLQTCAGTAYCTPDTHMCQPLPGKDEPCGLTPLGQPTYCGHDLTCDISKTPAICTPLGAPGADCTGLGQSACQSELRCLCPYGTPAGMPCMQSCYAVSLGNQPCDDVTSQCHPGFTCTAGKCVPRDSQGLLPADCQ
jgi:hypothetical protein